MHDLRTNRKPVAWFAAGVMLFAAAISATAAADTDSDSDKWKFDADIYLWGAAIKGESATGGDIDIPFNDLLKNLDMAFMGGLAASKGKYSLFADAIYLSVSTSGGFTESVPVIGPLDIDVDVEADIGLNAWIATLGGAYNVFDNEKATVNLVGGARYLWIRVKTKFDFSTVSLPPGHQINRQEKETLSGSGWDGIVGVKGKYNLNDKWYLPYYADIGTGSADFTWQAQAGVGYKFKHADVLLSYRYMEWNFKSDSDLDNLNLSGPQLGAKFYF